MSKIVIVGPAHPLRGGIADFNEAFAKSLIDAGHQVTIVSFKLQYPSILFPGKTQYRVNREKHFSFEIKHLINSINPISWIKTYKYILNLNPDKVFIRFWMPFFGPCLGYIAKRLKRQGVEVCAIVDNAIPHEKRFGDVKLVRYFINQCSMLFTLSNKVADEINSINPSAKVKTLFHPVYNTFGEKPKKEDALNLLNIQDGKYILFFGLIRKYKGLDLAIEAMSHPKIREMKIKLIIAGEFYEDKTKYEQLINELKLENILIFDHFIPKKDVPSYFEVADLIILPYITATQSGITQLAIYYQKPMIVNEVGGLPEVVNHNEDGLVSAPNSSNISKHIIEFFSNEELRKKINNGVKLKANEYSWEKFNKEILS